MGIGMQGPGISFFLTDKGWSDLQVQEYVTLAAGLGFREALVSLCFVGPFFKTSACSELDDSLRERLARVAGHAAHLGLLVTADITPAGLAAMGGLGGLAAAGIRGMRAAAGFSLPELAALSRDAAGRGMTVVLNASHPGWLEGLAALEAAGADFAALAGCHNHYPRPETGLDEVFAGNCSRPLLDRRLAVAAFLPGGQTPLPPLEAGLTTLEAHRGQGDLTAQTFDLLAAGVATAPYMGDMATETELRAMLAGWEQWQSAGRPQRQTLAAVAPAPGEPHPDGPVTLRVSPQRGDIFSRLWGVELANRWDMPLQMVRACGLRGQLIVPPGRIPEERPAFCVTVDNRDYPRYAGDVQIPLVSLPADPRVNVVGQVIEEDWGKAARLGAGQAFVLTPARP